MLQNFPIIKNISDVLPFIDGYPEFRVHERDGFTVIDYMISTSDTFKDTDPKKLAIRRECRGIAFDNETGNIVSRPFHKFHNVGENEYSQMNDIDLNEPHILETKEDGSMVRSIRVGKSYRLGTRAGITEHAMAAEVFVAKNPVYHDFIQEYSSLGYTCIFEWLSDDPTHQIVLKHKEPELVLTAVRDNISGQYLNINLIAPDLRKVDQRTKVNNIKTLVERIKGMENEEGVVIKFADGRWFKMKTDWYVKLHHGIDLIRFEKDVIKMILDGTVDDVYPALCEGDTERIKRYAKALIDHLNHTSEMIVALSNAAKSKGQSREDVAAFHDFHTKNKTFKAFHSVAMSHFRSQEPDDAFVWNGLAQLILKKCGSQTDIDAIRFNMLGGLNYKDFK